MNVVFQTLRLPLAVRVLNFGVAISVYILMIFDLFEKHFHILIKKFL